jgi:thioesterase domain-containing protein
LQGSQLNQAAARQPKLLRENCATTPFENGSYVVTAPKNIIEDVLGIWWCYKCQNPLYGIQAVDTEIKSIEELASFYIGALSKVQPKGCYLLLGMSFGGIIAYEMARQLEAKGDSVALLCMIDVERPASVQFSLSKLVELLEGKPTLDKEITVEKVIQSLGLGMLSLKDQQIIFNRVKAHLRALANYQPNPYGGNILFFQASQRFFRMKDTCLGSSWKELVGGRIEIQEIPGNHANILTQPQVRQLANFLDAHLQSEAVCQKIRL